MKIPFLDSVPGRISANFLSEAAIVLGDIKESMKMRKNTAMETTLIKLKKEVLKSFPGKVVYLYNSPSAAMNQFLNSFTKAYTNPVLAVSLFGLPCVSDFALKERCQIFQLPINPLTLEPDYFAIQKLNTDSKICVVMDNLCGFTDNFSVTHGSGLMGYFILNDLSEVFFGLGEKNKDIKNAFLFSIFSFGANYMDNGGMVCSHNLSDLPGEFKFLGDNTDYSDVDISMEAYRRYKEYPPKKPEDSNQMTLWKMVDSLVKLRTLPSRIHAFAATAKAWSVIFAGKPIVQPIVQRRIEISANSCPTAYPIVMPNQNLTDRMLKILRDLKIDAMRLVDGIPLDQSDLATLKKKEIFDRTFIQSELLAKRTIILPIDDAVVTHDQINAVGQILLKDFPAQQENTQKSSPLNSLITATATTPTQQDVPQS